MTATLIDTTPIDVTDDLTRAREVVATARSDAHTALVAHTALLTVETLAQQVAKAEATLRQERDEWTEWVRFAVERSAEVATEQDWCGVYDATMERLGLPTRAPEPVEEEVGWRCTVTLSREVEDDDVLRLVRDEVGGDGTDLQVTTSAVVTVDVRVTGEVTAEEGDCVCDSVDSDDIEGNLPDWCSDWEIDNRGTVHCDNG
jgi:hypothetical protein